MRKRVSTLIIAVLLLVACDQGTMQSASPVNEENRPSSGGEETTQKTLDGNSSDKTEEDQGINIPLRPQTKEPKTVMDFFALLPNKYFNLEGCFPDVDKNCRKARAEYLESFTDVEDVKNGYFKGGCDGGQSCIEMTIFKRRDKSYVVALTTSAEMMDETYFLDYKNRVFSDISTKIVPEFSKKNMYELPRYGTTVKVFAKKVIEKGVDYEISEKGKKLYDLEWKEGKFLKK